MVRNMMQYNINYGSNINTKTKYCYNCNGTDHEYKECKEPITSWGIILIKNIKNPEFLMVSRKNSLGFMEFIRGNYDINKFDTISFLFQQMIPKEIENISKMNFDELWNYAWNDAELPQYLKNDYKKSKDKYMTLRYGTNIIFSLEYYTNNIKSNYDDNEWGFPKGRRKKNENIKDCALREFYEETGIKQEYINIVLENIEENLIGTNGIKYRHIYFVAILKGEYENIELIVTDNEIGEVKYFTYEDCIKNIRNYHVDKKRIITNIYNNLVKICL